MVILRMVKVTFNSDYSISIELSNGHSIAYAVKNKVETARFHDILDYGVFCNGKLVDGKIIRWNSNTELSLDEILLNVGSKQ